jgi:membrane associated rhomboid family serine protease
MTETTPNLLELILRQCATSAPEPWYPSAYARSNGVSRDSLDDPLNRLRQGGLIQIVDWVKDKGQGYILTPSGQQALQSPRDLERLKNGQVPQRKPEPDEPARLGVASTYERGESVREALLSSERPVVTQVLLLLNFMVFLAGILLAYQYGGSAAVSHFLTAGGGESMGRALEETGALSGFALLQGQWWRLLTMCFVHAGLIHLAVNMYALFALGPRGEQLWGRWRFLVLYLLSGLGGSTVAMVVAPTTPVVGASGALCGLFAAEGAWLYLNRTHLEPVVVSAWARSLFLNALLIAVIVPMMFKGVSNSAHFGGALGGLAAAGLLHVGQFGSRTTRWLARLGLVGFVAGCIGLVLLSMNLDPTWIRVRLSVEAYELKNRCKPAVDAARQQGWMAYEEAAALVHHIMPPRRDPSQVKKALAELGAAQAQAQRAVDLFDRCGPYEVDLVEQARQRAVEFLTSFMELCRQAEYCLTDGTNYAEDEAAMSRQETVARGKDKGFKEAVEKDRQFKEIWGRTQK